MQAQDVRSVVITVKCQSRPGIVAAFSQVVFECHGDIMDINQHNDKAQDRYFMRMVCQLQATEILALRERLNAVAARVGAYYTLRDRAENTRTLIMVSRFDHCLNDLLYRWRIGELTMQPVGIVSNHPKDVACSRIALGDIPFYYLPVSESTKDEQEDRLRTIIADTKAELVVLARYMQVLSNRFAREMEGRCINIHHSFLPGFKGAKPYHQAYRRGVKLIGATAHYVTSDLDEGPIIEQDVERVTHSDTAEDLVRKGRDIERRVLSRAVMYHLEGRVILNDDKTVVFLN
ncbi:formyltetrahydrofolate deformylase [Acetobacter sp.]|uniref:formyltetrahydrofolate deformylase n=1 Tax=Acetobacter sp. TaxID=440 RepID=UPI0039E7CC2F